MSQISLDKEKLNHSFLFLTMLGAAAIYIFRLKDFAFIYPSGIMLLYISFGATRSKVIRQTTDFADSVYYMGFIFTLVSLFMSVALKEVDTTDTSKILELFGISIVTTIIGITARVLLSQYQRPPEQTIEDANVQIALSVEEFLDRIERLNDLTDEKISLVTESFGEVSDYFKDVGKQKTDEMWNSFSNNLSTLSTEINSANDEMIISLKGTVKSLESSYQQVQKEVEEGVISVSDEMDTSTKKMKEHFKTTAKLTKGMTKKIEGLFENVYEELHTGTDSMNKTMQKNFKSISKASEKTWKELTVLFDETYDTMNISNDQMRDNYVNMTQNVERITSSLSQFERTVIDFEKKLTGIKIDKKGINSTVREISNVSKGIKDAGDALNKSVTKFTKTTTNLEKSNNILKKEIDQVNNLIDEMSKILENRIKRIR